MLDIYDGNGVLSHYHKLLEIVKGKRILGIKRVDIKQDEKKKMMMIQVVILILYIYLEEI